MSGFVAHAFERAVLRVEHGFLDAAQTAELAAHRRHQDKISRPERDECRTYKGFHLFSVEDRGVLLAIVRGHNVITGFRHADLAHQLPHASANQVSRYIKRLRVHGFIKRIGHRYKYYITNLGRRVVLTGPKLREFFVIPNVAALPSPT